MLQNQKIHVPDYIWLYLVILVFSPLRSAGLSCYLVWLHVLLSQQRKKGPTTSVNKINVK